MRTLTTLAAILLSTSAFAQSDAINGSVGGGAGGGGGGGGVSQSYVDNADALKLNLDASNDPLTGALSVANGSVTAPGLTFAGDTSSNSGLYLIANDQIGTAVNGALTLSLTSSAFTVVPVTVLAAGTAASPGLTFTGETGSNSGFYLVANDQLGASIAGSNALTLTSSAFTVVPVLNGASGSVTAPAFAFSADADGSGTGIYRGAANDLRIALNGVQQFRLVSGTLYLGSSNTTYIDGYDSSSLTQFVGRGTRTDLQSGTNSASSVEVSRVGDASGYLSVYGGGQLRASPLSTSITATTDTTSSPVSSTACRISSTGPSNWTPAETSATDGMFLTCVNTGSNVITVTTSTGVCECGAGIALGQWDSVTLNYVSDRWVCTDTRDN
jgi:hypothetical protein